MLASERGHMFSRVTAAAAAANKSTSLCRHVFQGKFLIYSLVNVCIAFMEIDVRNSIKNKSVHVFYIYVFETLMNGTFNIFYSLMKNYI